MDKRQDGHARQSNSSRLNKRIQVLEEHLANTNREVRKLSELIGARADTNELFSLVDKEVLVTDVTGEITCGVLKKIGKWTFTIETRFHQETIFKGNTVKVVPKGD